MIKKLSVCAVFVFLLLFQRPAAQPPGARIYFVDIGQGAGTLIVSPTGRTLLVDGGPGGGGTKIASLLNTLGIGTIDFTVVTHYHIDHMSGVMELLNAGRVAGIAYDNGDGPDVVPPGSSTSASSTHGTYLNYIAATNHAGVARQTIAPGRVIDLGGGMQVTCLAAGGRLLSGGSVPITNDDLNSESVSLLVEYNNFDYLVSGDLTGGGSTSTSKTPDVETYVGQMAGDVDVIQLSHHGSTTTSNQWFLSAAKAEVAVAQASDDNNFGHPNRESVNKYLNTPTSNGHVFSGTGVPPPGLGPVFYQPEAPVPGDDRVTLQAFTGAASGNGGNGTLLLQTDGSTTYTIGSLDDGFVRISSAVHVYPVDGASAGLTIHFPPTVVAQTLPVAPLAAESVAVSALVNERESPIASVTLAYALNGTPQAPLAMTLSSGVFAATIPAQPDGTRVDYSITAVAAGRSTTYASGYFSGTTTTATLHALNPNGEPLYTGYAARIHGTVAAGTFSAGTNDDYVADATGAINVYKSTATPTGFTATAPGQVIDAVGRVGFNGGRFRLDLTESVEKATSPYGITVVSTGAASAPQAVTIAQLNASLESFEGRLVSIANTSITAGSIPGTPQNLDAFVTVSDGSGTMPLKIDKDTDIEGFTPAATFTLVGIVQQDDYLRPFDSGYNVAPRSRVDIGAATAPPPALITIAEARADLLNNVDGTAGADFVPDRINQTVRVRGVVTSIDFRGGNGIEYYMQDATGGVDTFSSTANFGPFAIGDSVETIGLVTQFNGLTELTVSSMSSLGPGTAVTPQVVTLAQLADGGAGEALEGRLVRVDNVTIASGTIPPVNTSGNLTIADATGSAEIRIDSDTNIDGTATPAGTFSVTGLVGQSDTTSPFDSRYQIFPRSTTDIVVAAPTLTASPASVDFGSVLVGGSAFATVTITNTGAASITLTPPFAVTGANANQFAVSGPGVPALATGESTSITVTFAPTAAGSKAATLSISGSGGALTAVSLAGTGQGSGGGIVISELRTRGPAGGNDEFVEIYNNSEASIDISGYKLKGSNNAAATTTRATVPGVAGSNTTVLPARSHYLFTNTGAAGYSGTVPGNSTYATGVVDEGGLAITTAADVILDQVGFSAGSAFKEGSTLTAFTTNTPRSYERKVGGLEGSQVDSDNNANDFGVINPSDPQNLSSPPTPGFSVSPTAVSFGTALPGVPVPVTLTLTNLSSTTTLTLTPPFALTGPDLGSFSVAAPGSTTLAAGGATTVVVTFQPSAPGAKSATLTLTSARGKRFVPLSGTASAGIAVDQDAVDFGSLTLGDVAARTVVVTNNDMAEVTLTPPFSIAGANAGLFSVGAPSTSTLAPGESASVALGFTASSVGNKTATLTISSLTGGSRAVSLTGSVACSAIDLSPSSLPAAVLGIPYAQTLSATGGSAPYSFAVTAGATPGGITLASGGSVSGTPGSPGSFGFTVTATDASGCTGAAPYVVNVLSATLSASPAPVPFGSVALNTSAPQPVTITNTSAFAVTLLTPFAITGANATEFSAAAPGTTALAAGASTTVTVTLAPTTFGSKTAALSVTSTGGGATTVALSGSSPAGSSLLVSEFRFRGPTGANDEFVEISNNTASPIDISGYKLKGSNNAAVTSTRATVPAATILPARAHYLFTNSNASGPYSGTVAGNRTYGTGFTDDGGVALTTPSDDVVDQVGLSAGSAFKEGTPLVSLGATNADRGYERRPGGGLGNGADSDNNVNDFIVTAPSAPQNLASPIAPELVVSPASVDFGNRAVGGSASATVTITNQSAADVTWASAITGSGAASFSVSSPATTSLAPGAITAVDVTYRPTAVGPASATLTLSTTDGSLAAVSLSGTGQCGILAVNGTFAGGSVGAAYAQSAAASGGLAPYTFSVTAGSLPSGISLGSAGQFTGVPSAAGTSIFTLVATDAASCSGATSASIVIAPAPTLVTWPAPPSIVYGTALGAELDATADVPGSFVYTPVAGTVLDAGMGRTLTVVFTPADSTNYTASTASVTIDVSPAPLVVTAHSATREFGAANPVFTGTIATAVNGDAITAGYASAATAASPVGDYPIVPALSDLDGRLPNYAVTIHNGTLTVVDTTAPVIDAHMDVSAEATSSAGALVTYAAPATHDAVDGDGVAICGPAPGSAFPLGGTHVTCTSVDAHGNAAAPQSFTVAVVDSTPPAIEAHANVTATTNGSAAIVTYAPPAVHDLVDGDSTAACSPASGSTFPVGDTTVSCTATDAHGNPAAATSFTVTVIHINQPPVAMDDAAYTLERTPVAIPVLANDVDVDGGALSVSSVAAPSHGAASVAAGGITYTPAAGYYGPDAFDYVVSDGRGGLDTGRVSVTVSRIGRFVVLGEDQAWLRANASAVTGDAGASTAIAAPRGHRDRDDDGESGRTVEVRIGENAKLLQPGSRVAGDTVWLQSGASVHDVLFNELENRHGSILGAQTTPVALPFVALPPVPLVTPGTDGVTVQANTTMTLAPGRYGHVRVREKATLILTGGLYQILTLDVDRQATVMFRGPTDLRIARELDTDGRSKLIVDPSAAGVRASNVVISVLGGDADCAHDGHGSDGDDGGPAVVHIGEQNIVEATIYAPHGTLWIRAKSTATGAFIAERVRIGERVVLRLDSAFKY